MFKYPITKHHLHTQHPHTQVNHPLLTSFTSLSSKSFQVLSLYFCFQAAIWKTHGIKSQTWLQIPTIILYNVGKLIFCKMRSLVPTYRANLYIFIIYINCLLWYLTHSMYSINIHCNIIILVLSPLSSTLPLLDLPLENTRD